MNEFKSLPMSRGDDWSFGIDHMGIMACLYCLMTGEYFQQKRVSCVGRPPQQWMIQELKHLIEESSPSNGSSPSSFNHFESDQIWPFLPELKRNRYRLSRSLRFVQFWEELFDALRGFDDDCSLCLEALEMDTKWGSTRWRQKLSLILCQHYRQEIIILLRSRAPQPLPHEEGIYGFREHLEEFKKYLCGKD